MPSYIFRENDDDIPYLKSNSPKINIMLLSDNIKNDINSESGLKNQITEIVPKKIFIEMIAFSVALLVTI